MEKSDSNPAGWNSNRIKDILIWIAAVVMAISVGLTLVTLHSVKVFNAEKSKEIGL